MPKKNTAKSNQGFTLIELLIVIVIIGILAGILVSILDVGEYQAQARDARRMNDMLSVQTAIIDSMAMQGMSLTDTSGCVDCTSTTGTDTIDGTGWVKFNNLNGRGLIDVISVLPEDPINNATYFFSYFSDGFDFELNMVFESDRYQINAEKDGGNDDTVYERGFNLTLQ
ncbi:prepilin-type N-terminal cleavage/methylation domain-containing protein [Patescibacteria group bacterium]